ncbi:MAG: hypothetical protein ABF289_16285, partial [Clostridiales bacterium]
MQIKHRNKYLKKIFAVILVITFLVSTISTPYAKTEDGISPLQIVIVESMALDEPNRGNFVTNVLEEIETQADVDETIVNDVKNYLPSMSLSDIEEALIKYSQIDSSKKDILNTAIRQGLDDITGYEDFSEIKSMINTKITGNQENINGLKFLIKLLKTVSMVAGPIAADDESNPEKIVFGLNGNTTIKNVVSSLMDSMESLMEELDGIDGSTNFDKLLKYCEDNVNYFSNEEIHSFKEFLDTEGIYEDIGDPGENTEPSINLNPHRLEQYYDKTTINITGMNIDFDGSTTVQLYNDSDFNGMIDPGETDTEKVETTTLINSSELSFDVIEGLQPGNYIVKVTTGDEIATTGLNVVQHEGAMDFTKFTTSFDPTDKASTHIEFTTGEGDYSNASKLRLALDGQYVNDDFPVTSNDFNGFFNKENLIITNVTDSTEVSLQTQSIEEPYVATENSVRSYINNSGVDAIGLEIKIEPDQIQANKKYRITFGDDLSNTIFSSAINAIIPLEGNSSENFNFRITDEWDNGLAEERSVWDVGTTLQAKESISDDFVNLVGEERVKYQHMYNKDISDVKEFGFYFFDNLSDFTEVKPTTDQSNNVSIDGDFSSSVNVDVVNTDSNNDSVYIGTQLETPIEVIIEDTQELEFKGEIGNYFNALMNYEFSDEFGMGGKRDGARIFAVVKDSAGNIVSWKEIKERTEMLVANPSFEVNVPLAGVDDTDYTEGDEMPYIGYDQEYEDQPRIILYGTGQENADQLILNGETVKIPFFVRINRHFAEGEDYRDAFSEYTHFVNHRDTERYNTPAEVV